MNTITEIGSAIDNPEIISFATFLPIGDVDGLKKFNTLYLNAAHITSDASITDAFYPEISNFQNLLLGDTTSGGLSIALGENYSNSGFVTTTAHATSGSIALDAGLTTTASTYTVETTSGGIAIRTGNHADTINAKATSGGVTINSGNSNDTIDARTTSGGITLTTADGNDNIYSTATSGGNIIVTGNGDENIFTTTTSGGITITTGNGNNDIYAGTQSGSVVITTGGGNDDITVASGSSGVTINAGAGVNRINLLANTAGINTIIATDLSGANLVSGSMPGNIYHVGSIVFEQLVSTAQTIITGTTSASVSAATGILSFEGAVDRGVFGHHVDGSDLDGYTNGYTDTVGSTDTAANFAAQVLTFLEGTSQVGKVVSYDDGANQWLFMATNTTEGHYIQLVGVHSNFFAGASVTAGNDVLHIG